jgi:hypothetical protein
VISPHSDIHLFHIPVMGTGFSTDTPLRVAQYGISSVVSLVDDVLLEQLRKYYADQEGEPYTEITADDDDPRARRITEYFNLINRVVQRQVREIRAEEFGPGSRINRYFELLPNNEPKKLYLQMLAENDPQTKAKLQEQLRELVRPGSIDANIMTKVDRTNFRGKEALPTEYCDALAALRGYAQSDLCSSVVFSAGFNQRLFSYLGNFEDFFPDENGSIKKKVILKVSDFRSAEIQGKFLARRGIWVSEFRVESGLNCGGHAFPTKGLVMGPILEQFKQERQKLVDMLSVSYSKALKNSGRAPMDSCPPVKFTAQGGIGTNEEHELMLEYYELSSAGWGTPFLLVPEVTSVDDVHLQRISEASNEEVFLSGSSPLGIPFWNLHTSDNENLRKKRVDEGKPGSGCPKGYAVTNTEFTELPICTASRLYQQMKLKSLSGNGYNASQIKILSEQVLARSCICHDLSGSVKLKNGIENDATPAICCGPNIAYFSKITTLEEMIAHIYGYGEQLCKSGRPHMFVQEMSLYIDYLKKELELFALGLSRHKQDYLKEFKLNLTEGLEYYRKRAEKLVRDEMGSFMDDLKMLYSSLDQLEPEPASS